MTDLSLSPPNVLASKPDVLLVGALKAARPKLAPGNDALAKDARARIERAIADLGFRAEEGEVLRIATMGAFGASGPSSVVVAGLGERKSLTPETLRRAAGTGMRAATGARRVATTLALGGLVTDGDALRAVCEGALLGAYEFTAFQSASQNGHRPPARAVAVATAKPKDKAALAAVKRAQTVSRSVALVRDLVNTPPGDMYPSSLADVAAEVCAKAGCEVTVFDDKYLKRHGYGGLIGVGSGSMHPPRLVRIAYRHPRATRHIALVGKGITFDSGGLSLKPAKSMETMKLDMSGAAAVIAVLSAIGRLKPKINVTGWAPSAENMPSGSAIRPGDVLTIYGGKKVEVLNTDAEGRLVLADALVRAAEETPDVMLDVATLTGAQLVALGARTAGVMGNDDDLRARVCAAAEQAGELVWPMPLPPELRKSIESDVADITNTGDRYGGMLVGSTFLKEFVPDGLPWAHIDIAGPAYNDHDAWGYTPKGGTGAVVRLFVQFVEDEAAR